ncbi:MAG: phospholipid carrier-dependent glycosyltransferase [Nitrososphaera sp.]|nr:phospholipid carrier-dependent glycosyltransferase [Nitrososphaera sp.]
MRADLQSKVYDKAQKKAVAILFALVIVGGLLVAVYMFSIDRHALLYYGDAVSHLVGARKLFDWAENPGWAQIGTVWLPLPHILLMFPSLIDALFFTGFAGLVVSLPSLALTSVFLYKIAVLVLTKIPSVDRNIIPYAGYAAALLYALNPNFLYLGITAMTEAPFMLFFVGSVYYFLVWYGTQRSQNTTRAGLKFLLLSSILVCAATLSRYEGWILPLFIIPFATFSTIALERRLKKATSEASTNTIEHKRPGQDVRRDIIYTLLVSLISLSGVVFWLVYNAVNYEDPLEFANMEYYSAAFQASNRSFSESLFLQPANVLGIYGAAALLTYGPVLLPAAAVGYFRHARMKGEGHANRRCLYIMLALPPAFTIASLLIGIGEMGYWFNSRFVILLAPLLILLAVLHVSGQPKRVLASRPLLIGVIVSLFVFQAAMPAFSAVVTLADAKSGYEYKQFPYSVQTGEKLGALYDGNGSIFIMTGSPQEHRIMLAGGIPLKSYDSMLDSSTWKKSFYEPWKYNDRWIVMSKEPDSDAAQISKYWSDHRGEIDKRYHVVYENAYYEILLLG